MASIESAEEGDGEGYFASVSDMMVGILFIFLLLLTVFALNFHEAANEQKIRSAEFLDAQKRAKAAEDLLKEAERLLEKELKDREAVRTQLLRSLQQSLSTRGVKVSIDLESGILRLPEDLLFKTGDATIRPENLPRLQTLAEVLADILPCYVEGGDTSKCDGAIAPILETVLVEGHTDRQAFRSTVVAPPSAITPTPLAPQRKPIVTNDSELKNDRLSTDRALNVFKELRRERPSLDDLRNSEQQSLLGFSGYGPRRPLPDALGSTPDDYQKNRRIDLRFVLSARTSEELSRLQEQIQRALSNAQ